MCFDELDYWVVACRLVPGAMYEDECWVGHGLWIVAAGNLATLEGLFMGLGVVIVKFSCSVRWAWVL